MCNNSEVLTYDWIKTGGRSHEDAKNRRLVFLTRLGVGGLLFVIMNIGWLCASRGQKSGVPEPE